MATTDMHVPPREVGPFLRCQACRRAVLPIARDLPRVGPIAVTFIESWRDSRGSGAKTETLTPPLEGLGELPPGVTSAAKPQPAWCGSAVSLPRLYPHQPSGISASASDRDLIELITDLRTFVGYPHCFSAAQSDTPCSSKAQTWKPSPPVQGMLASSKHF